MAKMETDQLNRMMLGAALSRAICTIADVGVADRIDKGSPRSVAHLAKATGCHERSLHRALRFLASHGLFRETKHGEFDHTDLSASLRSDAAGSYRAAAQMFHHTFAAWDGLDQSVRTGQAGFEKVYGKPIFEYLGEHTELAPIFDAGMTCIHQAFGGDKATDFVFDKYLGNVETGNVFVEKHQIPAPANRAAQRPVIAMIGQEKQPIDMTRREPVQINELLVEAIACAAQDDTISDLRSALFDSAGELGIERIGDIGGGDADDVCRAPQ